MAGRIVRGDVRLYHFASPDKKRPAFGVYFLGGEDFDGVGGGGGRSGALGAGVRGGGQF